MSPSDVLTVGAGLAGAVCARSLAEVGLRVLVIDRRAHVGGNAYDEYDAHGVLVHRYGPHIFHTNSEVVYRWLSQYTEWRPYEHRVLADVDGQLVPLPVNRTTINRLYHLSLDEDGVAEYLTRVREARSPIRTSEDVVLSRIGRDLCDKLFRGYTRKQWGLELSELKAGVAGRIPTRTNDDDRYFTDTYQALPAHGYAGLFARMLDHPNIVVQLNTEYADVKATFGVRHTVYTGRIDEYFENRFGDLPYRSLRFEHEHLPNTERFQPAATINYPNTHPYTRITEFKQMTGQRHSGTSIVREYPEAEGDPFYPIPRPDNDARYQRYRALAQSEPSISFVGRLAEYRYYNMDQVVAAALKIAAAIERRLAHG
jgi:UDP-galactopyranose mutase